MTNKKLSPRHKLILIIITVIGVFTLLFKGSTKDRKNETPETVIYKEPPFVHKHKAHLQSLKKYVFPTKVPSDPFLFRPRHQQTTQTVNSHPKDTKVIVFWTKFFDMHFWLMEKETYTPEDLKRHGCPITNCILTHNRRYLGSDDSYDGIIFHAAENTYNSMDMPKTRSSHQVYVMASKECPPNVLYKMKNDHKLYNLTMTYRLDSDIGWVYGRVIDKATGKAVAPNYNPSFRPVDDEVTIGKFNQRFLFCTITSYFFFHLLDNESLEMIRSKTKTAAWFVSNCGSHSHRNELRQKLQLNGIDVDVYGNCGILKCPLNSIECDRKLNSTYKFYLSFENSLCTDYVTEKVFRVMKNLVIPVVYNGAKMERILPPKSYINAEDFATVKELAEYLKFLSDNEDEYIKYFWWREYYHVVVEDYLPVCDICSKISLFGSNRRQVIENIFEWYAEKDCRRSKLDL